MASMPHPEPRGGVAIDLDVELESAGLAVVRYVDKPGNVLHALQDLRRPLEELVDVGVPQRELVLRVALPRTDADIARGDEAHIDAAQIGQLSAHPVDHLRGRLAVALAQRLEADEHAALVHGGVEPRSADRRADVIDGGVLQDDVQRLALQLDHRLVGDVGRCLGVGHDQAGVIVGEEALGRDGVEVHREHDHAEEGKQRDGLVAQRHRERARISLHQDVEGALNDAIETARPRIRLGHQEVCADHRRDGERYDDRNRDRGSERH